MTAGYYVTIQAASDNGMHGVSTLSLEDAVGDETSVIYEFAALSQSIVQGMQDRIRETGAAKLIDVFNLHITEEGIRAVKAGMAIAKLQIDRIPLVDPVEATPLTVIMRVDINGDQLLVTRTVNYDGPCSRGQRLAALMIAGLFDFASKNQKEWKNLLTPLGREKLQEKLWQMLEINSKTSKTSED